jgi:hypothetical protein
VPCYLVVQPKGTLMRDVGVIPDSQDLPQEITMHRFPTFEFDKEQSAASRAKVEAFVQRTGARLWIEHDLATFTLLKKAPAFYE